MVEQVHQLGVLELWAATAVIVYVVVRFSRYAWAHWTDAHGAPDLAV